MAYGDFKYLTRRVASNKVSRDKAFNIAKNPKYAIKNENMTNKKLLENY